MLDYNTTPLHKQLRYTMRPIYRPFEARDYQACEAMVNQAWHFDTIFKPQSLSNLAKFMYTRGALVASNDTYVAEVDGQIIGFLFGLNEGISAPKQSMLFGLKFLWKLLVTPAHTPSKKELLNALSKHQVNRNAIISAKRSEIVLFVIDEAYQGQGIGTTLWNRFKTNCNKAMVSTIFVETNLAGASAFYEKIGFKHLEDFDSPLHELATKGGQAAIYHYYIASLDYSGQA